MAISITKPTIGGNEDTWGSTINTALDTLVDAVNGTSGTTAPNLSTLTINGTDVTSTAAELNKLDGFTGTFEDLNYAKDLRATGVTTTEFDKLDGLTASTLELNKLDGVTASTAELNKLDGVTATTAELNHVDGVSSNIQTQLNAKQATITGAATTIDTENLTANRALISNSSGKVAASSTITTTELGYLNGVTSNIQTQLNGKLSTSGGTVSGNLTATGDVTGDLLTVNDRIVLNSYSTSWFIDVDTSGNVLFKYGSVTRAKLDASGNLSVAGNVTAYASL